MSDVPRPFKQYLDQYKAFEDQLLNVIYTKYLGSPLTEAEAALVKEIDDDMLYYDLSVLLNETSPEPAPVMKSEFSYEVLPFEKVEKEYLEMFGRYVKTIK